MYNLNGIDSKFRLAILVARRAKQLIGGAKKKVDIKANNVLTIALEEFKQGKIDFDVLNEDPSLLFAENQNLETEGAEGSGHEAAEDENESDVKEKSLVSEDEAQPQPES